MEIKLNDINDQEKELEITAPWDTISDEYNDILKKYSRLSFKGYRPGKAPAGVLESFFRNEIRDDLVSATSARLCRTALKEVDMEAGTPVEISDIESSKDHFLRFKASFIRMPEFDLPDYHHLGLESEETEDKLNEISRKLLELTEMELHPRFIEQELAYQEMDGTPSEEDRKAAGDRVRLLLILKKIALQDNIEIDEKDMDDRINMIASENDVTPGELKDFLITNNGLSRLSDTLLAESVLSYIIELQ